MDERLLDLYSKELRHLREMAGEFARDFPKMPGACLWTRMPRRSVPILTSNDCWKALPGWQRESISKWIQNFPVLPSPSWKRSIRINLSPVPSMAVVRFDPDEQESALAEGLVIPRGTLLRSQIGKGERTALHFSDRPTTSVCCRCAWSNPVISPPATWRN